MRLRGEQCTFSVADAKGLYTPNALQDHIHVPCAMMDDFLNSSPCLCAMHACTSTDCRPQLQRCHWMHRSPDSTQGGQWMRGGGWRAWVVNSARAAQPNEVHNEIDRLRAELRGDFRSALRHAYVGPRSGLPHRPLPCLSR